MRAHLPLVLSAGLLACSPTRAPVMKMKIEQDALGRVVVYRNGVAYYERKVQVAGDTLAVTVPRARVDDFLKSLTVQDARTGQPVPVSFAREDAERSGNVVMLMRLPHDGEHDLRLTYVTESPAWKPSYRVVVGKQGEVSLQGWAIVDNTSGEEWKGVRVGVGSSSALSFRYDLWSVRDVQRQTLRGEERFAAAPPTGMSPYKQGQQPMVATLDDGEIERPKDHPDNTEQPAEGYWEDQDGGDTGGTTTPPRGGGHGGMRTKAGGGDQPANPRPAKERAKPPADPARWHAGNQKLQQLAQQLRSGNRNVVINGYADANESEAGQRALDRANLVRNQLIDMGAPPATVKVASQGRVEGKRAGVEIVEEAPPEPAKEGQPAAESDTPVGESHFESDRPMDVPAGTSVMVSVVRQKTEGDVVYLYDAMSERGNERFAFKAVRMRNPTESTLETGPVTVYGDGRFIGEGLTDPIPPGATAVVPFALDRQVVIDRDNDTRNEIAQLITLQRGVLTAEVRHIRRTQLTVTNRLAHSIKLFIRHPVEKGWELRKSPKLHERVADSYLFALELDKGESRKVEIEEGTPLQKTIDLHSPGGIDMISLYLAGVPEDGPFAAQMKALLAVYKDIGNIEETIHSLRERLADYRERMDELHGQLVTLQMVKTSGELMKHLKTKMTDISERVQKATIDLVNEQEKLMLARIRFQDGLAELTLEPGKQVAAKTP
jgi:OmpA family protein